MMSNLREIVWCIVRKTQVVVIPTVVLVFIRFEYLCTFHVGDRPLIGPSHLDLPFT